MIITRTIIKNRLKKFQWRIRQVNLCLLEEQTEDMLEMPVSSWLSFETGKHEGEAMCLYLMNEKKYNIHTLKEIVKNLETCCATKFYGTPFMKGYFYGLLMMLKTDDKNLFIRMLKFRLMGANKTLDKLLKADTRNNILGKISGIAIPNRA